MYKLIKNTKPILWIAFTSACALLMFQIIFPYTSWKWDVDFLQTKQLIIHLDHYRIAFYSHIFSSLIILFSGGLLFVNVLLKKYASIHRLLGKLYVGLLLGIAAPSGFVMAFYANGGWMAKASFLILTPLWWWFTYKGYQTARSRQFSAHRIWMMRSYALTLSAITLRFLQFVLSYWFYLDPTEQYIFVSWVSWGFNLAFVEIWIWFKSVRFGSRVIFNN
ncbi:MAG: DUF2306 domain-containing protein [Saprospiraceae bacterium]